MSGRAEHFMKNYNGKSILMIARTFSGNNI